MAVRKFDSRRDYYRVLGVKEDASKDDVDRAYRSEARKRHPDGGGTDEDMKSLNEAHDVLSDPETRRAYDAQRPGRKVYAPAVAFDPEAASRAGTLEIPVKDADLAGLLMGAAACFGVGIPLLLLVEMQWIFVLWPLRVLSLGAIVLGVFMAHSALALKRRKLKADQAHYPRTLLVLHELVFWVAAVAIVGSLILFLYLL